MACAIEDAGFETRNCINWIYMQGFSKGVNISKAFDKKGTNDLAKQWDDWHSDLKPSHKLIYVGRKPLSEKTIVDNVEKWGTGALNIGTAEWKQIQTLMICTEK